MSLLPQNDFEKEIDALLDIGEYSIPKEVRETLTKRISEIKNYIPKVGIFGKTGVGKSSLCNALFGKEISEVSDVAACTRSPKEFMLKLADSDNQGLVVMDCPGIGETPERDEEYMELYRNLIPQLDLVLWVLDSSERAYGADISAHRELFQSDSAKQKFLLVLNKVDNIKPKDDWNIEGNHPGEIQSCKIDEKANIVATQFEVESDRVCCISVEKKFSLGLLMEFIISAVPNDKKYSFVREAEAENITEKAADEAKKGFFEALWENVKGAGKVAGEFYEKYEKPIHLVVAAIWKLLTKTKK